MPTPSDSKSKRPQARWDARPSSPPHSVFSNFNPSPGAHPAPQTPGDGRAEQARLPSAGRIEQALARSFFHRLLAKGFEDPDESGWRWLASPETREALRNGTVLPGASVEFDAASAEFAAALEFGAFADFAADYVSAFGHAARGRCPINEIEYGDPKADPLFQPHRLADLAAFYRAFALEATVDGAERQDHLCVELEFMSVLAAKEAYACAQRNHDGMALVVEAQRKFLREHLGRWAIAFAGRLGSEAGNQTLAALARLLRAFVRDECARFGVPPGADVLALRPVDEAEETLCGSCGMHRPLPGAKPGVEP